MLNNRKIIVWKDYKYPNQEESYERLESLTEFQKLVLGKYYLSGKPIALVSEETGKSRSFVNITLGALKRKLELPIMAYYRGSQKDAHSKIVRKMVEDYKVIKQERVEQNE